MSRQERRRLEKELRRHGEQALKLGLPVPSQREPVMGLAAVLRKKLREKTNDKRASEAAQIALRTLDLSLARRPPEIELACKAGCSYCCYTFVSVFPPEVFSIAGFLRGHNSGGGVDSVIGKSVATANLDLDQRHGAHLPCPLLVDNRCSTYGVRPLVCRKAVSPSVDACIVEFNGGEVGIQMPYIHISLSQDVNLALQVALRSVGLPDRSYELSGALRAALINPDIERQWLNGDDVFKGVYQEMRPSDLEHMVEALAAEFTPA